MARGKKHLHRPSKQGHEPHKRTQSRRDKEKPADKGEDKNDKKIPMKRRKTNLEGGRLLACPFFKFNPIRHMECMLRNRLKDLPFVVQHVLRSHELQPIHCLVCGEAFRSHDECDSHTKTGSCERRAFEYPGLTQDQQAELRKPRRHLNEEQRWFAVWDIAFPGSPQPDSPYVGSEVEEILGVCFTHHSLFASLADCLVP